MASRHQPEHTTEHADLELPLDLFETLWRVATWEYDLASDQVYWLDAPSEVLNLADRAAQLLVDPLVVSLREGAPWEYYDLERAVDDRAGNTVDIRMQARRVRAPDGTVTGCVGVAVDVSEQRHVERELRGVVDRYRRLVELSPDCIAVHQQGSVRYVNPAGVRMAGASSHNEIVGRPITDFLAPDSIEDALDRIAALSEPGMASEPSEAVLVGLDGTRVPMEAVSVRTQWEGEPAYQVILRDISERRRAEAALRYQASLVAHVSDAIVATDRDGRIQSWNPAAEDLYGWREQEALGQPIEALLGASAVAPTGGLRAGEVEHQTAQGRNVWVLTSVARVRDELGEESGQVIVGRDLTARIEREAAEARFSAAIAALDEGVIVFDDEGKVVSVNDSARAVLGSWLRPGISIDDVVQRWRLVDEGGFPLDPRDHLLLRSLHNGEEQSQRLAGFRDASETRWLSVSMRRFATQHGGGVVCSFTEITGRKRAEEELTFQATHDALTRLPNRDLVIDALSSALRRAPLEGSYVAVYLIDLDRFKAVNDSLGHAVGDRVLQEVARRLMATVGGEHCVGRLAGDEFVVVSRQISGLGEARRIAQRLADTVNEPIGLPSGRGLAVTASIGVALAGGSPLSPRTVLSQADLAMYQAKQRGRARVELFDEELQSRVSRRLAIQEALREAVDSGEIRPYYQPLMSVDTGELVGFEALARWKAPGLGDVSPADFIPVAESTGVIGVLGSQITRRACADAASWPGNGSAPIVSVNVSPRQLADPGFVDIVVEALELSQLDPRRLWLEVTESILVEEGPLAAATLRDLQTKGVHFAIDDFGTGYSSLSSLRRLPVEALKIDRSFVEGIGRDPEADAIVETTMRLARSLNLRTIAEGVETEAQLDRLQELECDVVQGFLISPALAAADLPFDPPVPRSRRWRRQAPGASGGMRDGMRDGMRS